MWCPSHLPNRPPPRPLVGLMALGLLSPALLGSPFLGCSSSGSEDRSDYTPSPAPGWDVTPTAAPQTPPPLPPETEDAFYRAAPAASDRFVFVVNPDRDTLTKINASTRAVYTLPVGIHPTQVLVGARNPERAVVLNEGEASLSIVEVTTDAITRVPIHPDTNFMGLSPDGRFAITWFSALVDGADTDVHGARSFSSISVVFTGDEAQAPTSTPIATALNPRNAVFLSSRDEALVLCDNTLAQVTLSASPTSRLIPLTDDIDEELQVAELKVSPDGSYAFLRMTTQAALFVVDLLADDPAQAVSRIPLAAVPSDMDQTEDLLILVDRSRRELLLFDNLEVEAPPQIVATPENQLVGSLVVAPDMTRAILYTTLTKADLAGTAEADTPLDRFSVWDLTTGEIGLHALVKPVASVSVQRTAAADVATFIHQGDADSDVPSFDNEEALSHFYFSDGLVVPTLLESPVKALANAPGSAYELLILEESPTTIVVDFQSRQLTSLLLQSQPAFVGLLSSTSTGYVSQEHDLGRLSFVDAASGTVSTITGFELNSQP